MARQGLEADPREDVAASVRTISDDAEAQRVAEVMHRVGLPAPRYKGRLLTIADGCCIAHIDFPDPSGGLPFVKIRVSSVPPGSMGHWGPVSEGMASACAEFRPPSRALLPPLACAASGAGRVQRRASPRRASPDHGRPSRCGRPRPRRAEAGREPGLLPAVRRSLRAGA